MHITMHVYLSIVKLNLVSLVKKTSAGAVEKVSLLNILFRLDTRRD